MLIFTEGKIELLLTLYYSVHTFTNGKNISYSAITEETKIQFSYCEPLLQVWP